MKKIYGILLCLALMAFKTNVQAQSACDAVTAEVIAPSPQTGSYNSFGARVSISQPYEQDITVNGTINEEGGNGLHQEFTLTIPAGSLFAETTSYLQVSPVSGASVSISSVTPCPSGGEVQFTMTPALQSYIAQKQQEINNEGNNMYSQVDALTSDVTQTGNGTLTYPNYVRFVQIGDAIDELNHQWDNIYAAAMEDIVSYAFTSGAAVGENNEANREKVWDIIEENHFIIPEEKASLSFEQKFNFNSLRVQISNAENQWLENGSPEGMGTNPALNEDLPEAYWTLVTPGYGGNFANVNVYDQLNSSVMADRDSAKKLLTKIKAIVDIIRGIIQGIQALADLLEDCGSSTEAHVRHIRDGFETADHKRKIGYEMEQRSVTLDFGSTDTKIQGKAKLYKIKDNGKDKKDRKNTVGINFCAKEWNICDGRDWPSDAGFYNHPINTHKKKVDTWIRVGYALGIDKSYHYISFNFFALNNYERSINLLGAGGCN